MNIDLSTRKGMTDFLRAARFSYVLSAVVALKVADHLVDGDTVESLSKKAGVNPPALLRILQSCSHVEIFKIDGNQIWHTSGSKLLLTKEQETMAPVVQFTTNSAVREAYGDLPHAIKTGQSSFEHTHKQDSFSFFAASELGAIFSNAMESVSFSLDSVCAKLISPFCGKVIMDVGGGKGGLLKKTIKEASGSLGILADLPEVISSASKETQPDNLKYQACDFFKDALPNADSIILRKVLHDWTDDECKQILLSCRKSLNPGGKLIVIEVARGSGSAHEEFGKSLMDIEMLVMTGKGGERSIQEFEVLFSSQKLKLVTTESIDSLYTLFVAEAL